MKVRTCLTEAIGALCNALTLPFVGSLDDFASLCLPDQLEQAHQIKPFSSFHGFRSFLDSVKIDRVAMSWWFNDHWQVWICDTCNGWEFEEWDALVDHLECNHHYCMPCRRGFVSAPALRSHYANNSSHAFCTLCNTHFASDAILHDHKMYDHFPCEGCNQIFATELGRYEHGRQAHPFCQEHRRAFLSEANLNAVRFQLHPLTAAGTDEVLAPQSTSHRERTSRRSAFVPPGAGAVSSIARPPFSTSKPALARRA